MPYLAIETSARLTDEARPAVLRELSRAVAEALGKQERYVMVSLRDGVSILFGGDDTPAAWIELKSIGFPDEDLTGLAALLCDLAERHLGVPPERVYIEFTDAPRHLLGWNRRTFVR